MVNKEKKCPLCGKGHLIRKKVRTTYKYKRKSVTVMQPGEWCTSCGEGFLTTKDMQATQDIIQAMWKPLKKKS